MLAYLRLKSSAAGCFRFCLLHLLFHANRTVRTVQLVSCVLFPHNLSAVFLNLHLISIMIILLHRIRQSRRRCEPFGIHPQQPLQFLRPLNPSLVLVSASQDPLLFTQSVVHLLLPLPLPIAILPILPYSVLHPFQAFLVDDPKTHQRIRVPLPDKLTQNIGATPHGSHSTPVRHTQNFNDLLSASSMSKGGVHVPLHVWRVCMVRESAYGERDERLLLQCKVSFAGWNGDDTKGEGEVFG